jgi:hypothetical protein
MTDYNQPVLDALPPKGHWLRLIMNRLQLIGKSY